MKYITMVALCLLPIFAHSQNITHTQKMVTCADLKWLVNTLAKEYNEFPIFTGIDANKKNQYVLTLNPQTLTWTMVEYEGGVGCVIGTGTKGEVVLNNILKNGKNI